MLLCCVCGKHSTCECGRVFLCECMCLFEYMRVNVYILSQVIESVHESICVLCVYGRWLWWVALLHTHPHTSEATTLHMHTVVCRSTNPTSPTNRTPTQKTHLVGNHNTLHTGAVCGNTRAIVPCVSVRHTAPLNVPTASTPPSLVHAAHKPLLSNCGEACTATDVVKCVQQEVW